MKQYLDLLQQVLTKGVEKGDRTGKGTLSIFGTQMRFDLSQQFPLLHTKKIHTKSVIHELLWMLGGDTNIGYLQENGVTIWDEWADANGDLGPVYGAQWRRWGIHGRSTDQIAQVVSEIILNPSSRRLVVSAWNVDALPEMRLHPCHCLFQFYVAEGKLSCSMYQRSADIFLGVPFNIASYAFLTHMVAQQTGLDVGELIWTGGDTHLYLNHIEQAKEQLTRNYLTIHDPKLYLKKAPSIFEYIYDDFMIENYHPLPAIKAEVAV